MKKKNKSKRVDSDEEERLEIKAKEKKKFANAVASNNQVMIQPPLNGEFAPGMKEMAE